MDADASAANTVGVDAGLARVLLHDGPESLPGHVRPDEALATYRKLIDRHSEPKLLESKVTSLLDRAEKLEQRGRWQMALPIYDLFATTFTNSGVLTYPNDLPTGVSWHLNPGTGGSYADPTTYPATRDEFSAAYGEWAYTGPTDTR